MYVHLGEDVEVRDKEIIGIFNIEDMPVKNSTRDFLINAERDSLITYVSDNLPKSMIICTENIGESIYLSNISSNTIFERTIDKNKLFSD